MKVKRIAATTLAGLMLLAGSAHATPNSPFGNYGVSIASNGASATAFTQKCSCSPVNNYLAAWIQVQYKSGNSIVSDPVSSSHYYYDSGYNIAQASKTVSHPNTTYAKGIFRARCGSGDIQERSATAVR
jgi:hypothetical protein